MTKARTHFLFVATLLAWLAFAIGAGVFSGRWAALTAIPVALVMFMAARAERMSQAVQLAWPVVLLPGACFAFIGVMQALGYGQMDHEPATADRALRAAFFATGLLLHLAAFALLAMESRASDHPGGEIADRMP